MSVNPLLGVAFHWLGGLSSASFYVPYKGVRRWSWEVLWLTGGLFSWLIGPWVLASLLTHDLLGVLARTPPHTLAWCAFFGCVWGVGGLTFGLSIRYLGLSLGMAIALGFTTAFGTLVPPIFAGDFTSKLLVPTSGRMILAGILVTLLGIAVVAYAGRAKERELRARTTATNQEFRFAPGALVAVFSGIMSSGFAYGLAAGAPIRSATLAAGTGALWQGLPVICVVLLGGFSTNFIWCACLIARNRSAPEWLGRTAIPSPKSMLLRNYLLCALGGLLWYFQFFFYTMGESQMGRYGFSSWTLHMASIIVFSTFWGFALAEWRDTSRRTLAIVWTGIALLVGATLVIGWGNALAAA